MSVEIKYKGNTIASANTDTTKTLKTSGKYCEGDIEVVNTQDGGITPTGSISITQNGTYDVTEKAEAVVNVSGGGAEVQTFAITLEEDSMILPLSGITKIPELLSITMHNPHWETAHNRYSDAGILTDLSYIYQFLAYIPNSWAPHVNSGNISAVQGIAPFVPVYSTKYISGSHFPPNARYGSSIGKNYSYPTVESQRSRAQEALPVIVKAFGYKRDSNGNLVLDVTSSTQNPNNRSFGAGLTYYVSAVWGTTPRQHYNYFEFDRTVNATNVTEEAT